jgi:hypothetical protein
MALPTITRTLRLDPDGPPVGCTWGGRARPWGPPVTPRSTGPSVCERPARWHAVDDVNDAAWFLCDLHLWYPRRRTA